MHNRFGPVTFMSYKVSSAKNKHSKCHYDIARFELGLYNIYKLCLMYKMGKVIEKKVQLGTLFVPYLEPSGEKGSQKDSLHVQEPRKVPYITKKGSKNGSKDSFRTI